ncbi:MAG: hypothetical protein WAS21_26690 [Geminicoccaceae bacterium]
MLLEGMTSRAAAEASNDYLTELRCGTEENVFNPLGRAWQDERYGDTSFVAFLITTNLELTCQTAGQTSSSIKVIFNYAIV